jgi:hypothetical protein
MTAIATDAKKTLAMFSQNRSFLVKVVHPELKPTTARASRVDGGLL